MISPENHPLEPQRISALESYSILDTLPEADFDNLTEIAAQICETPISLVSLIDEKRQWFKSHYGLTATETPREYAFCAHAIHHPNSLFIVEDTREDVRFADNPLVTSDPNVIFYAGFPLVGLSGLPLGTLCVIDHKPKRLSAGQIKALEALSKQVMNVMELRKEQLAHQNLIEQLNEKNKELERFAFTAAHDLKSPLNNISILTQLLKEHIGIDLNEESRQMLDLIENSSAKLSRLIDGLLNYSKAQSLDSLERVDIDLFGYIDEMKGLFMINQNLSIELKSSTKNIKVNKTALDQIFINLISNSVKYSDKEHVNIAIEVTESSSRYQFSFADNSKGIDESYLGKIFNMFEIFDPSDRFGQTGNGIGLATVKRVVQLMGGSITVKSTQGEGSTFTFTIKK